MAFAIRPANDGDLDQILAVANSRSLQAMDQTEPHSDGFLVSEYTLSEYEALLQRVDDFLVAEDDGVIIGFIVAYGSDRLQPDEWLNLQVREDLPNFLVVKQIATAPSSAGRGVGTALYKAVLEHAGSRRVVAAVVTDPPNPASEALHRKLGFEPYLKLTPPDGLPRAVWLR